MLGGGSCLARAAQSMIKCVLSIAGSDSGAGAGIQADLKTMAALGVYGLTAVTAVTAQNTVGVARYQLLDRALVEAQIDMLVDDFPVDAVKTGMLGSEDIVRAVAEKIKQHGLRKLVVDPVMVAKSGDALLVEGARLALQKKLLPLALLVTPNIPEAEMLSEMVIETPSDMQKAARLIHGQGPSFVLLKGGHLPGSGLLTDILFDGEQYFFYRASRVETRSTHGTGCTYASAIAAYLARRCNVPTAVKRARTYLQAILPADLRLGKGHGPMDHFGNRRKIPTGRW